MGRRGTAGPDKVKRDILEDYEAIKRLRIGVNGFQHNAATQKRERSNAVSRAQQREQRGAAAMHETANARAQRVSFARRAVRDVYSCVVVRYEQHKLFLGRNTSRAGASGGR